MGTHFFWDPIEDNIIQERDDTGAVTADYTTEPYLYGDLISQRRGGVSRYHSFDGQGSTRALTDSLGNVTDSTSYTAFGEVTERTGTFNNPFEYFGMYGYYSNDFAVEYRARRRTLVATIARWTSVDPISGEWRSPYAVSRNSPLRRFDPSGLFDQDLMESDEPDIPSWITEFFPSSLYNGPCASYVITTRWKLTDDELKEDSLIIQHVQNTSEMVRLCGSKSRPTDVCNPFAGVDQPFNRNTTLKCNSDYYEVWRIHGGKVFVGDVFATTPMGTGTSTGVDVFAQFGFAQRTSGSTTKSGVAILVPLAKLSAKQRELLEQLFKSGATTSPVSAGILFSACAGGQTNNLWKELEKLAMKRTTKRAVKTWDCCDKHKSTLCVYVGSTSGPFKKVPKKGDCPGGGTRIEPYKDYDDPEPVIENEKLKKFWDPKLPCDCPT